MCIVCKIVQYLCLQRQTKVMNEGQATFWHYTVPYELYDRELISDAFTSELLQVHANMTYQPPLNSLYYSGLNPYTLGFPMLQDIRHIYESPGGENYRWASRIAGNEWQKTLDFAVHNFKDESPPLQFLSPCMICELKLLSVLDNDRSVKLHAIATYDEDGYCKAWELLAGQCDLSNTELNIQVTNVNVGGDRSLALYHLQSNRHSLEPDYEEMLRHVVRLWGFMCRLEVVYEDGRHEMKHECRPNQHPSVSIRPALY